MPVRRSKLLLLPNAKSPRCRMISSGETGLFQFLIINSCQFSGRLQYLPIFSWKKCVSEIKQVSRVISSVLSVVILQLYWEIFIFLYQDLAGKQPGKVFLVDRSRSVLRGNGVKCLGKFIWSLFYSFNHFYHLKSTARPLDLKTPIPS